MIRVLKPGLLTTVQDLGRRGSTHLGVSPGGAADQVSFRIANALVGNQQSAPALEVTLIGPTIEFDVATTIAICGGVTASIPMDEAFEVPAGTCVALGPLSAGARAYLAVRGGLAISPVMGSCSTFLPAKFGGLAGRALSTGDTLTIGKQTDRSPRKLSPNFVEKFKTHERVLRATASLQSDWFDHEDIERFYKQPFIVTDQSNRSGLRLNSEPILTRQHRELLTEGIALGAVQVPPDGQPIILFIDQQTTGGYPKIANVIAADLPRVGQLRPRDQIKFQPVSIPQAIELLRSQERELLEAFS
ncbi:MAG TPA: biotin-dependent carboxyltransferase family protein [Terriglobales bacterium]